MHRPHHVLDVLAVGLVAGMGRVPAAPFTDDVAFPQLDGSDHLGPQPSDAGGLGPALAGTATTASAQRAETAPPTVRPRAPAWTGTGGAAGPVQGRSLEVWVRPLPQTGEVGHPGGGLEGARGCGLRGRRHMDAAGLRDVRQRASMGRWLMETIPDMASGGRGMMETLPDMVVVIREGARDPGGLGGGNIASDGHRNHGGRSSGNRAVLPSGRGLDGGELPSHGRGEGQMKVISELIVGQQWTPTSGNRHVLFIDRNAL